MVGPSQDSVFAEGAEESKNCDGEGGQGSFSSGPPGTGNEEELKMRSQRLSANYYSEASKRSKEQKLLDEAEAAKNNSQITHGSSGGKKQVLGDIMPGHI